MSSTPDSKTRFSDRVSDYSRYRPSYPSDAMEYIFNLQSMGPGVTVADVGSGTGLFTELLLDSGASVIAVEPNKAMRSESDKRLKQRANYSSCGGSAESSGLKDNSVNMVTAAQAFHWFDLSETKIEFKRILKPEGVIVLIWNRRDPCESEFLMKYEALLQESVPEYNQVTHANVSEAIVEEFLGTGIGAGTGTGTKKVHFKHFQDFDLVGLKGRLLSSSYCPAAGEEGHAELMQGLEKLYSAYATSNGIRFDYRTEIYHTERVAFI